ncbi:MAG: SDR family oxidoreductase [Rhodospirillales bacterium]
MAKDKKVAIVTGSATGLGAAAAKMLAEQGWAVVINYTKSKAEAEETEAACRELGGETLLVQANVADDADCRKMVQATIDKWGRVDGLINNAGISKFNTHANLDGVDREDFLRIYSVNVIGAYQMTRAVTPHMKKQGKGSVVNISSVAGVTGIGSSIPYAASKGALNTMTLSLARALGPEIRVNAVCPGFIQSRWLRSGLGDAVYENVKKMQEETTPLKHAGTPEDMAEVAVWFITGASNVTGEILISDAGMHLGGSPLKAR